LDTKGEAEKFPQICMGSLYTNAETIVKWHAWGQCGSAFEAHHWLTCPISFPNRPFRRL